MLPQKHYTYLWAVLLAFTLNACTPDDGPQPCNSTNTYFNLTAEQLNKTPYFTNPLFDTISFASNKGDTLTFALTKIDTTYFTQDANTNPNNLCSFWEHYQNITAKYTTIKGVGSFEVGVITKDISLFNVLKININNYVFYTGLGAFGDKWHNRYVGDYTQGGNLYKDVLYTNHNFQDSLVAKIYLNSDFGLITLKEMLLKNEYYYLKK
ncbi:MAG: hypothetical protein ACK5XN_01100 [Bacteroidota bacterium]